MSSKEEIFLKFFDFHERPTKLLGLFNSYFKSLIENNSPNRLTGRKLSQTYSPALSSIIKQCNIELSKKQHEDYTDYILEIMHLSLSELSKVHMHYYENSADYYNLWYSMLIRMSDLGKTKQTLKICFKIILEIESVPIYPLLINFYVLASNCLLQSNDKGIEALEKVYDLLAIKSKHILTKNKNLFDGQTLNKIYQNAFKLLMKTGKLLDNLAAGNIPLHQQALSIRNFSLQYLKKTKPLILSDYFAFVYSSVLGCYKIGTSCGSNTLFQACIDSIDLSLDISTLPYTQDKNLKNLVELKGFLLFKLELYNKIKPTLSVLVCNSESLVMMIYSIKYYLDISRASFLGKLEFVSDMECLLGLLRGFFDGKLTAPSVLAASELAELKEVGAKVFVQFDNWAKIIGNLHTPNAIKTGLAIPPNTLKLILDMLSYLPKLLKFLEKLECSISNEPCLFNYIIFLSYILLYISTRDSVYANTSMKYLNSLVSHQDNKYLSNCYNVSLGLLHVGEKDLAIKISVIMLDSLNTVTQISIAIMELASKHVSSNFAQIKHVKKTIQEFLIKQANLGTCNSQDLEKIVEIYSWLQIKEIESGGECTGIPYTGDKNLIGAILEKEIDCYYKKLLSSQKTDTEILYKPLSTRIQIVIKTLLWEIYTLYTNPYISVLVKYIEILSACSSSFQDEKIISCLAKDLHLGVKGTLKDQTCYIIKHFILKTSNPLLTVWDVILGLEKVKENEKGSNSDWISRNTIRKYCKIVQKLKRAIEIYANKLGCKVSDYDQEITRTSLDRKCELSKQEIKSLCLGAEISRMLKLYIIEIQFINLLRIAIQNSKGQQESSICLEYRKNAVMIIYGKEHKKILPDIKEITDNTNSDDFYLEAWTHLYKSEALLYTGKIEESQVILSKLLNLFPASQLVYKKAQLLKSYILYFLSWISLVQGNYNSSMSLCKDARLILRDFNITTLTFHNLSLSSSLSDAPAKKCYAVYPGSSWSFQYLSLQLSTHMADIYTHLSQIPCSIILLTQGIKLGRLLGMPSIYLYFRSRLCTIVRQTHSGFFHDNIREQILNEINPVEFIEGIYSNFFVHFLDVLNGEAKNEYGECLAVETVDQMSQYIDPESLCVALMTLGDVLQTPSFYIQIGLQVAEQSYYKLAKYLLGTGHNNYRYAILRSMVHRKLAILSYRQYPEKSCLDLIQRSVKELACCSNYIQANCCGQTISPLISEELGYSVLNLSDVLLRQSHDCGDLLEYILKLPNTHDPIILNHTHYLLSRYPGQSPLKRSFHILMSIGSAYDHQAFFKQIQDPEELYSKLQSVPEDWTVVALSIGRGNYSDGSAVCRLQKNREPVTFVVGNNCCTGNNPLFGYLEDFCEIMKESSETTSKDQSVVRVNSSQWWDKRERLNDRLRVLLENIQKEYFGVLLGILIGKIKDSELDRLVYNTAKDFISDKKCICGELWNFQLIYSIFVLYLCDLLPLDTIKSYITSSIYSKCYEIILKKLKTLKKQTKGKKIEISPVILLISGQLLHIPWESLPIFQKVYVTRVPSLNFLLSKLPSPQLSYKNGYYILNPSKDLESTQKTFQSYFLGHLSWSGLIETAPTESEFSSALETKDILIYCGHSSGEQYLKGEKIKTINIKAVTFLIGCSSGLLRSQGIFDPQGVAIQYMIGKCPGLLANLWDVTDKDIDRFSLELLRTLDQGDSIGNAISKARNSCRLKYLIGAAPVWYGIPLEFVF